MLLGILLRHLSHKSLFPWPVPARKSRFGHAVTLISASREVAVHARSRTSLPRQHGARKQVQGGGEVCQKAQRNSLIVRRTSRTTPPPHEHTTELAHPQYLQSVTPERYPSSQSNEIILQLLRISRPVRIPLPTDKFIPAEMSSSVLADRDVNASAPAQQLEGAKAKGEVMSMEYHRQMLQDKLDQES